MALLDFLGQDVGGYREGPNPTGGAGLGQAGMTYGDILGALMRYGSSNSSTQALGGLATSKYGAGAAQPDKAVPRYPVLDFTSIDPDRNKDKTSQLDAGTVASLLAKFMA